MVRKKSAPDAGSGYAVQSEETDVLSLLKAYYAKLKKQNKFLLIVIDEFGKDTTLVPIDDNHFEIAKLVRTNPQFYSWIAMFGKRAQIISPPEVVEEMKTFSEKIYDMYHSR